MERKMNSSPAWKMAVFTVLACAFPAAADVRLPKLFTDHMLVQRDKPVPVWGWADAGEVVGVEFAGQAKNTTADASGKWMVRLDPLSASAAPRVMTVKGKTTVEIKDVLVGEVWICCGQSNMEMPVGNLYRPDVYPGVADFKRELAGADQPLIRLFRPDHQTSLKPKADLPGSGWQCCTPETAARFSAVGYFFGRHLQQTLKVPVGMIQVAKSSTIAEAWTSPEGLRTLPKWEKILDQRQLQSERAAAKANTATTASTSAVVVGGGVANPVEVPFPEPGCLFNGMVAPLVPLAIRGIIYYQGESNAKDPNGYRTLFPALIRSWRQAWGQGDLPFLFVQLANYRGKPKAPREDGGWAAQREAQAATLTEPNTGMAVTIDIGSGPKIHPPNKQDVGRRLGLLAQALAYGQSVECYGPQYRAMKTEGDKVRIQFDHLGGGLEVKPFKQGQPAATVTKLHGFAVAGTDKVYHWADAEIAGDEVVLRSPDVPRPVTVRYAWSGNPDCNLYNKAGLPAAPFRSDVHDNADLPPHGKPAKEKPQ